MDNKEYKVKAHTQWTEKGNLESAVYFNLVSKNLN